VPPDTTTTYPGVGAAWAARACWPPRSGVNGELLPDLSRTAVSRCMLSSLVSGRMHREGHVPHNYGWLPGATYADMEARAGGWSASSASTSASGRGARAVLGWCSLCDLLGLQSTRPSLDHTRHQAQAQAQARHVTYESKRAVGRLRRFPLGGVALPGPHDTCGGCPADSASSVPVSMQSLSRGLRGIT
jgi:hypothetical protein